jgi:hypothetical protein
VSAKVITRGHSKSTDRGDEEKAAIELTTGKLATHCAHLNILLANIPAQPRPQVARYVRKHGT